MKQTLKLSLAISTLALILSGCDSNSAQDKELIKSLEAKIQALEKQLEQPEPEQLTTAAGDADTSALEDKIASLEKQLASSKTATEQSGGTLDKVKKTRLCPMRGEHWLTWFF